MADIRENDGGIYAQNWAKIDRSHWDLPSTRFPKNHWPEQKAQEGALPEHWQDLVECLNGTNKLSLGVANNGDLYWQVRYGKSRSWPKWNLAAVPDSVRQIGLAYADPEVSGFFAGEVA